MVPKQIFFIWLGDQKPDFVDFSMNAFREVNPSFKVDLVWWTIAQIENTEDRILRGSIDWTLGHRRPHLRFIQNLADVYRMSLLNEYGGIYLDADTFPIRPFDDALLAKPFNVTRSYNNNWAIFKEIFFVGKEKWKG